MDMKVWDKSWQEMIEENVALLFGVTGSEATVDQIYKALATAVNNILRDRRKVFNSKVRDQKLRRVYYLSMEFLLGKSLRNNIYNLGQTEEINEALKNYDLTLEDLCEKEPDAALGNGGLGRLGACYLDSLASLNLPAMGFSLRYEYGLFKQKIVDGYQTELPDIWLPGGEVWLAKRRDKTFNIKFDGYVEEKVIDHSKTRLFPTTGGILKTMNCSESEYNYLAIDGVENCINTLKDIENGSVSKCFIEMSACVGGCIAGPIIEKKHCSHLKDYVLVNNYAGNKDFEVTQLDSKYYIKNFAPIDLHKDMPSEYDIAQILKQMGKTKKSDELNCGSCGYNTCREKAIAIYQGKAQISMCLPYLKEKAESFSDSIVSNTPNALIVLNDKFEVQQINAAAKKLLHIKSDSDVLGDQVVRILDPVPFIKVLDTKVNLRNKKVYLAEYEKYVEQTIIYDANCHLLICIMRDVTEITKEKSKKEEISKQTIEIADKVVDKQMRIVQEIASLLGETAAETKIALTKLKESITDE